MTMITFNFQVKNTKKTKTHFEEKWVLANALNWFDEQTRQFAFHVDQVVQRLCTNVCKLSEQPAKHHNVLPGTAP